MGGGAAVGGGATINRALEAAVAGLERAAPRVVRHGERTAVWGLLGCVMQLTGVARGGAGGAGAGAGGGGGGAAAADGSRGGCSAWREPEAPESEGSCSEAELVAWLHSQHLLPPLLLPPMRPPPPPQE
eukprot:4800161-Prymnesium_polylepis.1